MKIDTILESLTMNLDVLISGGALVFIVFLYKRITNKKTTKTNSIRAGNNSTNIQADGNVKVSIGKPNEE